MLAKENRNTALATNTSKMFSPASRRKRVFTPQIREAESVNRPWTTRYVRMTVRESTKRSYGRPAISPVGGKGEAPGREGDRGPRGAAVVRVTRLTCAVLPCAGRGTGAPGRW